MSSLLCAVKRFAIGAWLLAIPVLVTGQNAFSPGGNDYRIAGALPGDQTWPQAAINTNGGYLVWQDNAATTNELRIRAGRLNSGLTMSAGPFLVSTNVLNAGDQEKPQVSLLNGGGAVIVWQGGKQGFKKIYTRFLAASGSFITNKDALVNTYTNEFQIDPAVATLADGSVVIVWSSYGQDGDMQGIFGQRFSATGAKLGAEFQINQYTLHNQRTPAVAALTNGNFVVVWVSELQRASASVDVYARIFNSSGATVGNEFPVNTTTSNICANPSIAGSPQGGFAVVWGQNANVTLTAGSQTGVTVSGVQTSSSPNGWDVFGRVFDANGLAIGGPVRLNTYTYGDQYAPKISSFGRNYLTVWISLGQDSSWEGIFGQFLLSGGIPEGVEFQVNSTSISRQINPSVASDGVSRFLVLWSSFVADTSFDLFARSYDLISVQLTPTPQGLNLSWNTQPGSVYQVQISTNNVAWNNLGSQRAASGYSDSITVNAGNSVAFYRVVRVQ